MLTILIGAILGGCFFSIYLRRGTKALNPEQRNVSGNMGFIVKDKGIRNLVRVDFETMEFFTSTKELYPLAEVVGLSNYDGSPVQH